MALTAACCASAFAHSGANAHEDHVRALAAHVARSSASYVVPNVALVRADGVEVAFPQVLEDGKPTLLQFVYTTCTTVCPLTSQVFSAVQAKLGQAAGDVHMVSISIDPEHDTPARLSEHARKFGAGPHWQHYTGTSEAAIALQRAFDVYRGDKMNHMPVTFLWAGPGHPWVRLEGLASPDELMREYVKLACESKAASKTKCM